MTSEYCDNGCSSAISQDADNDGLVHPGDPRARIVHVASALCIDNGGHMIASDEVDGERKARYDLKSPYRDETNHAFFEPITDCPGAGTVPCGLFTHSAHSRLADSPNVDSR